MGSGRWDIRAIAQIIVQTIFSEIKLLIKEFAEIKNNSCINCIVKLFLIISVTLFLTRKFIMKKKLIFAILILSIVFSSELLSQSISFRAGLNIAKMTSGVDDLDLETANSLIYNDYKSQYGIQFGMFYDFYITNNISIESGLMYSSKGGEMRKNYDYPSLYGIYVLKINLNYIELPIVAKYTHEFGKIKVFVSGGGYLGMGLTGEIYELRDVNGNYGEIRESVIWVQKDYGLITNHYKREDIGLIFGAGVDYSHLLIGLNFSFSLKNISPYGDNGHYIKNQVFSIYLGYRL